jgi:hypothetical protein
VEAIDLDVWIFTSAPHSAPRVVVYESTENSPLSPKIAYFRQVYLKITVFLVVLSDLLFFLFVLVQTNMIRF